MKLPDILEAEAVFKKAWHAADADGLHGQRVQVALRALFDWMETDDSPRFIDEIVIDHVGHKLLIDGDEFPYMVVEPGPTVVERTEDRAIAALFGVYDTVNVPITAASIREILPEPETPKE